jgi:hypothetical protein
MDENSPTEVWVQLGETPVLVKAGSLSITSRVK